MKSLYTNAIECVNHALLNNHMHKRISMFPNLGVMLNNGGLKNM
jgi:hypothetical protein